MKVYRPHASPDSVEFSVRDNVNDQMLNDFEGLRSSILQAGSPMSFNREVFNVGLLSPGIHQGISNTLTGTVITGLPGARIHRASNVGSIGIVSDLIFEPESDGDSRLLTIPSGSKLLFNRCIFTRPATDANDRRFVVVDAGAKVVFSNCIFMATGNSTGVMDNAGGSHIVSGVAAAADCQIAYCVNATGWSVSGNKTETGVI
jgi:hypothetical protein|tara:strand:+ start:8251 stop:8859 length:609 start_codon:yes stop_codon:yes gene_type:complete